MISDSPGMYGARYLIMPSSRCTPLRSFGVGIALIASAFVGSGCYAFSPMRCPVYFTCLILYCSLSRLNFTFLALALSMTTRRAVSCSCSSFSAIIKSSAMTWTLSISPNISSFRCCNISLAEDRPNGMRRKRFRPHGVLKVHR